MTAEEPIDRDVYDSPLPRVFAAMADELDAAELDDHMRESIVGTLRHWGSLELPRSATSVLDGIVQIELSIDDDRVADVVACLRAGAAAWTETPFHGAVDAATRESRTLPVYEFAAEVETQARRVREARNAEWKRQEKADAAAARRKAKGK